MYCESKISWDRVSSSDVIVYLNTLYQWACVLYTNAYNSLRNPRHKSAFTKIIKDENRNKENPGYLLISFRDSGVNTALMYTSKSLISRTKLPSANGPDMC